MSYKPRYDKGDWNAICDVCGRMFKASLLRRRWDNYMVCPDDWETRQPQDFVRGQADKQTVPWNRDESQDTFIAVQGQVAHIAISGIAQAGLAESGTPFPPWYYPLFP